MFRIKKNSYKDYFQNKNQEGTILITSVIITTTILVVGLSLGALTISEIKQTKGIDRVTTAYYAAEQGIEDGLYKIRKEGKLISEINGDSSDYGNISWTRTASDKEDVIYFNLGWRTINEDPSYEIYLYDPEQDNYNAGVDAITISCIEGNLREDQTDENLQSILRIEIYKWDRESSQLANNIFNNITYSYHCGDPDLAIASIFKEDAYKIKIISVGFREALDITLKAYQDNGLATPASMVDKTIINSTGEYIDTRFGIQARIPVESVLAD